MAASRTKPHIEPTTTPTTIARMMPARQTYKQADISQVCIYLTHTTQKNRYFSDLCVLTVASLTSAVSVGFFPCVHCVS